MKRPLSFDSLESRKLMSGDLVDPNYDIDLGWLPDSGTVSPPTAPPMFSLPIVYPGYPVANDSLTPTSPPPDKTYPDAY